VHKARGPVVVLAYTVGIVLTDNVITTDNVIVPELTPVYLLKVTGSFMGISYKGIPLGIWNSTAGEPQPGHKAKINPFSRFRWNQKYRKLMPQISN